MSSGNHLNVNTGTQGANIVNSKVDNLNVTQYNTCQPDPQIDISKTFCKYKNWICEEKEHLIVRKKLRQLDMNGKHCHIKRKLKGNEEQFPEDELLNRIPHGVTSLVTGPAGSGKSTLAASTMINWAESEESRFDLVLFISSLHKMGSLPIYKQLWGEYSNKIRENESLKIYEELVERKDKVLVIIDGLDEMQLSTDMETDSNTAVADLSKNISKEVMIYGILTNSILVGATVLGFSRTGNYMNKELFGRKLEVYSITDVEIQDIEEIIQNHANNPVLMKSIFQQLKQIGLNQVIFVMKILEHQEDFGKIETATDLFLIILRGNLAFQNIQNNDTTFSKLHNEEKDFMKSIFELCKENLQEDKEDEDFIQRTLKYFKLDRRQNKIVKQQKQAGVFTGTLADEENWVSGTSGTKIPLSFLKRVGIFEVPPIRGDQLILTAQHLSFVEFFSSVGILLNLDIKGGFKIKILNI